MTSTDEAAGAVTKEAVSSVLRDAGFGEAIVASGSVRVTRAGFRAYEHNGTVRLAYWPSEGDFEGANIAAPFIESFERDMDAGYAAALKSAGFTVDRSDGAVIVTGQAA